MQSTHKICTFRMYLDLEYIRLNTSLLIQHKAQLLREASHRHVCLLAMHTRFPRTPLRVPSDHSLTHVRSVQVEGRLCLDGAQISGTASIARNASAADPCILLTCVWPCPRHGARVPLRAFQLHCRLRELPSAFSFLTTIPQHDMSKWEIKASKQCPLHETSKGLGTPLRSWSSEGACRRGR